MTLVAGMDVSGNPNTGNHKFMGIVIGTKDSIDSMARQLNIKQFLPNQIKLTKIRRDLTSQLQFDGKKNIAFCVKIERDQIIKDIKKLSEKKHPHLHRSKIISTHHYLLLQHLREKILNFAITHKYSLSDIVFECDDDCRDFIQSNGLHHDNGGNAYMLSDLVAWGNNRGYEADGVISMDVTYSIKEKLKHDFK